MRWIAPSSKDIATATLEKQLWSAADELRANSGLTSAQYSQPVLGLIFLRFADAKFAARRAELAKKSASGRRGSRVDDVGSYHAAGVIFLPTDARFDEMLEFPEGGRKGKSLGQAVDDARRAIERENPQTRLDFREKFEDLIAAYNAGATQIEQLFLALLELSRTLTDEEARHVREQLTEEELVIFDLLTRPGPDLSTDERDEVKSVAKQLLGRVRSILTVDWEKTAQSRARVRDAIEDALDAGLPRAYTPDVFKAKAGVVFQHVYERYGRAA